MTAAGDVGHWDPTHYKQRNTTSGKVNTPPRETRPTQHIYASKNGNKENKNTSATTSEEQKKTPKKLRETHREKNDVISSGEETTI